MQRRVAVLFRGTAILAVAALAALAATPAAAQKFGEERVLRDLEKEYKDLRKSLFNGETRAKAEEKRHQEAIDAFAKLIVYQLTLPAVQRAPGGMQKAHAVFDRELNALATLNAKDLGAALTQMYSRQIVVHCLEVIQESGQRIAAVNAARMLARLTEPQPRQTPEIWLKELRPRLAGGNAEYLAGVLADLIKDKEDAGKEKKGGAAAQKRNDGVRYWALRALAGLLSLPPDHNPIKNKEAEAMAVGELIRLAERPVKFPAGTPRREVEGYKVLRREAIRALAACRAPRVGEKELVALTLARYAANDSGIAPPPRPDERLEAAIGLARLRVNPKTTDLNPDYAAQQLGRFVVDFAAALGRDKARERDLRKLGKDEGRNLFASLRPWKIDAARLLEALETFRATAVAMKSAHALKVLDRIVPVLEVIESGRTDVQPAELANWLTTNPPPNKELFKGVPESTVNAGAAELKTGK
jgi:hypothetical protein